jgi:hypothetical protein
MRVSDYYGLTRGQAGLKFLDVDISKDVKLFLNAKAIRSLNTPWSDHCETLLESFFDEVIGSIRGGNDARALDLLTVLKEPNETHLGLSVGESDGRGLGPKKAKEIWLAMKRSKAVRSGLLTDLEDTVLLIDGVSVDIVSDIITNVIRGPLISFTQQVCIDFGIPMIDGVASGPVWNPKTLDWDQDLVELPAPNNERLILVPKEIVRITSDYDVDAYYRHFVLERLKEVEIADNTALVHVLKGKKSRGKKKVYKTDLMAKYGTDKKKVVIEQTDRFPDLLGKYKAENFDPSPVLTHRQIADAQDIPPPDWDKLLADVISLPPGKKDAYKYEDAIQALMEALFYPSLVHPTSQTPIHDGLKRVDIDFKNHAREGFFEWVGRHYGAPYVFVECKNFGSEIGNPEVDQISMRMSDKRGKLGILVCRSVEDEGRLHARCKAAAVDGHAYILALQDKDLVVLVAAAKNILTANQYDLLDEKFKSLVM